jgi:hypothetical protein
MLSKSENVGNIGDFPAYVLEACPFLCRAGDYLFHWVMGDGFVWFYSVPHYRGHT